MHGVKTKTTREHLASWVFFITPFYNFLHFPLLFLVLQGGAFLFTIKVERNVILMSLRGKANKVLHFPTTLRLSLSDCLCTVALRDRSRRLHNSMPAHC